MAKSRSAFICQNCGAVSSRWQGKCEACNEWNTITEEIDSSIGSQRILGGRSFELETLIGSSSTVERVISGVEEFDRVTGGGFVPGSVILLGGEPGIGKSTLLIQICAALATRKERVIYISGEEAVAQVQLRPLRVIVLERCNAVFWAIISVLLLRISKSIVTTVMTLRAQSQRITREH